MIETPRLRLRPWAEPDRAPFAEMAADPRVMGASPGPMSPSESADLIDHLAALWAADGCSYGAIERRCDGRFLGLAGLAIARPDPPLCPAFELGFALARPFWGQGYAREAAQAWIAQGFGPLAAPEIIALAAPAHRAAALLDRLGFRPAGPSGPRQLFALSRTDWLAQPPPTPPRDTGS